MIVLAFFTIIMVTFVALYRPDPWMKPPNEGMSAICASWTPQKCATEILETLAVLFGCMGSWTKVQRPPSCVNGTTQLNPQRALP